MSLYQNQQDPSKIVSSDREECIEKLQKIILL
jgi:hypothetical protein